jgi:hypothetical protein
MSMPEGDAVAPLPDDFWRTFDIPKLARPSPNDLCAICLDTYENRKHPHVTLICGHSFHCACFRTWAKECRLGQQNEVCPYCRAQIEDDYVTRIATLDESKWVDINRPKHGDLVISFSNGSTGDIYEYFGASTAVVFSRHSPIRGSVFYRTLCNTSQYPKRSIGHAFRALVSIYTIDQRGDLSAYDRVRQLVNIAEAMGDPVPAIEFAETGVIGSATEFLDHIWRMRCRSPCRAII